MLTAILSDFRKDIKHETGSVIEYFETRIAHIEKDSENVVMSNGEHSHQGLRKYYSQSLVLLLSIHNHSC